MPKNNLDTSMGGQGNGFQTTRWSAIAGARTKNEQRRKVTVENLIRKYWKPVYCYLRRKGCDNETAKDLTQGFFYEVVLGRELIQQADEAKGRFRTFLLTALDRYVTSFHRKETARKRSPEHGVLQLEARTMSNIPRTQSEQAPEHVFNYVWATELLDQVLAELRQEYDGTAKETHWKVFEARILTPILEYEEAPPLADLCAKYDIESQSKASNMIITVKRRFGVVLRRSLRQLVESDSEVEDEYNQLVEILSKGAG